MTTALRQCGSAFGVVLAWGAVASAHPGHGTIPADSPAHYVLEPVHALPVVAIVAAIAGVLVYRRRNREQ
jgi:hypothetical protein